MSQANRKAFSPPQASIDAFNLVWEYAECTKEEAKYEKDKIMRNFDEMNESYLLMAEKIKRGNE